MARCSVYLIYTQILLGREEKSTQMLLSSKLNFKVSCNNMT